ncbi:Fungal Rad9-like Rad53-binding [Teratosphaeria destructans]|uniref:Fungal Rad9-like Rad53-binding n=1 Tax=Teratosphaeria destructans TaxID=418781 RepID=A0A9W7W468_9PEZI|nr:Fungal Rad9-like Rad53-binding [Teratosphaeria destructans]
MATDSMASVPHSHLQALREQLLHSPKLSAAPSSANSAPEDHVHTHTSDGDQASAVIAESADAHRTPRASTQHLRPQLSSSRSAPVAEMEAMINPSPSQDAFRALTRAESFHGYPGGDTQPMESQVYRDYTESMMQSSTTTPQRKIVVDVKISPNGAYNTYDTAMTTDQTPHTLGEGQTGLVDVHGAWQEQSEVVPTSPRQDDEGSDIEELLASPQTQFQVPDVPGRPAMPATPAMAGNKRNSQGDILTSDTDTARKTQTPGFSQVFGVSGQTRNVLSATQLFAQTQAQSSPAFDQLRSDPVMTRPSPNDHAFSPHATTSSPLLTHHGAPVSTLGVPRDRYTSMRESQEQRAKRLRADHGRPAVDEFDEEDEISQERRMRARRMQRTRARGMQRTRSDQALHEYSRARVSARAGSRPGSSRKRIATIDLVTPATSKKLGRVEFDSLLTDEADMEDVQRLPMNEDDQDDDLLDAEEDNDVYDELGQTVMRSQRDDVDEQDDMLRENDDQDDEMGEDEDGGSAGHRPSQDYEPADDGEHRTVLPATQQSAIKDSQPSRMQASLRETVKHVNQQSSMSSFIPGSQYAGKTSQEQARLRKDALQLVAASQPAELHASDKLPSSPPIALAQSSTLPEETAEASDARRALLAQFHGTREAGVEETREFDREIPESEGMAQNNSRPATSHHAFAAPALPRDESHRYRTAPFSTARTHFSASNNVSPTKPTHEFDRSPVKVFTSQRSGLSAESPRRLAGVRRFADIMAEPTSLNRGDSSGESQIDVEAILGDVITAEDEAFIEAMSSPARDELLTKRRKITHTPSADVLADMVSPGRAARQVGTEGPARSSEIDETVVDAPLKSTSGREAPMLEQDSILRSSPSKANQLPISTPENAEPPQTTQESTRKREQAGARTVSQLLSARQKRPVLKYGKPSKLAGKGRKAAAVSAEEAPKTAATFVAPEPPEPESHDAPHETDALDAAKALTTTEVQRTNDEAHILPANAESASPSVSNRIFALFGGSYNHFYPATYLSTSLDGKSYKVKFDDARITNIDAHHVRALDLRIDDQVKIDFNGMRKETWIITGFRKDANGEQNDLHTDAAGNAWLQVRAKPTARKSMTAATPGKDGVRDAAEETREVAVTSIYVTHTMWPAYADRPFTPPASQCSRINGGRLATPVTSDAQTPNDTPASRSRRSILPPVRAGDSKQLNRTLHLRDESVASSKSRTPITGTGLFVGMAFAISYVSSEADKTKVAQHLHRNGGIILEDGFEELFELPSMDEGAPTPKRINTASGRTPGLTLKPEFSDLGFVALIADRHSRRAKYMQALALGLPVLSGRWVMDCLQTMSSEDKAEAELLPWSRYLLPAGESAYLDGAVRSRTLVAYSTVEATLARAMANRPLLLDGDGVLMVVSKKNKAVWHKRKAYAFLTLALGAGRVKRVNDLQEAKAYVASSLENGEESPCRWIYVDGSVADAHAAMFEKSVPTAAGKKRKRSDQVVKKEKLDRKAMSAEGVDGRVRVVNDEFVVQSLILEALVE